MYGSQDGLLDPMNWICFAILFLCFFMYAIEDPTYLVAKEVKQKKEI